MSHGRARGGLDGTAGRCFRTRGAVFGYLFRLSSLESNGYCCFTWSNTWSNNNHSWSNNYHFSRGQTITFQSLARRSWFDLEVLNFGSSAKSKCVLGGAPNPLVIWAQLHESGSNLTVCLRAGSRTDRNRRLKDARRSVPGPLSAASAQYSRVADSDFGAVESRCLEISSQIRGSG